MHTPLPLTFNLSNLKQFIFGGGGGWVGGFLLLLLLLRSNFPHEVKTVTRYYRYETFAAHNEMPRPSTPSPPHPREMVRQRHYGTRWSSRALTNQHGGDNNGASKPSWCNLGAQAQRVQLLS